MSLDDFGPEVCALPRDPPHIPKVVRQARQQIDGRVSKVEGTSGAHNAPLSEFHGPDSTCRLVTPVLMTKVDLGHRDLTSARYAPVRTIDKLAGYVTRGAPKCRTISPAWGRDASVVSTRCVSSSVDNSVPERQSLTDNFFTVRVSSFTVRVSRASGVISEAAASSEQLTVDGCPISAGVSCRAWISSRRYS